MDAHDLTVMGASLADGGVDPVTGEWLYEIGPDKSGVAGASSRSLPGRAPSARTTISSPRSTSLILASVSAIAIFPASRVPAYRREELPASVG